MRTLLAGMESHVASANKTLAFCAKIKRRDGTYVAGSMNKRDFPFDIGDGDGEITYNKDFILNFSAVAHHAAVHEFDDSALSGAFQQGYITREDIAARLWDFATVHIFRINVSNTGHGSIKLLKGQAAAWEIGDFGWTCAVHGLKARWQRRIGHVINLYCRAPFGSQAGDPTVPFYCGRVLQPADRQNSEAVSLGEYRRNPSFDGRDYKCIVAGTTGGTPPTYDTTPLATFTDGTVTWETHTAAQQAATVSQLADRFTFRVGGFTTTLYPDNWFALGEIDFTSGANNGVESLPIIGWESATGTLTLGEPVPFDLALSDAVTLTAGCNKTKEDGVNNCKAHGQYGRVAAGMGGFRGEENVLSIAEMTEIQRGGSSSAGKK